MAAEIGKNLLERNKELEVMLKSSHHYLDEQTIKNEVRKLEIAKKRFKGYIVVVFSCLITEDYLSDRNANPATQPAQSKWVFKRSGKEMVMRERKIERNKNGKG